MKERSRPSLLFAVAFLIRSSCSQNLPLGGSINVHARYGHLEETMRVMPMDDDTPSFQYEIPIVVKDPTALPENARSLRVTRLLEGRMQIKFCDSVKELLKFYFRYFKFEGIDEPWATFRTNWSINDTAKHFGINSSFIGPNYSYVLVKYVRFHDAQRLAASPGNVRRLVDNVAEELGKLQYGNIHDLVTFYRKFGSHYISSYATGNAIYQVFVLVYPFYGVLKELIRKQDVSKISAYDMNLYFSPSFAVHVGSIQSASGNYSLDTWITNKLRGQHTNYAYSSIMEVYRNPPLIRELRAALQNEALLGLRLRSLSSFLSSPLERAWFEKHSSDPSKEWQPINFRKSLADEILPALSKVRTLTNIAQIFIPDPVSKAMSFSLLSPVDSGDVISRMRPRK